MGKRNHAIGMVLCLMLAVGSQIYSDEINALFQIDVDSKQDVSAPLIGLQFNESWLVVLVDFESNPLSENAIASIQDLQEYSEDYLSQAVGDTVSVQLNIHDSILRAPEPLSAYGADGSNGRDYGTGSEFLPANLAAFAVQSMKQTSLEEYDYNDDGVVDRFLILHSTLAQEQGSGSTNRIWSHFTSFSEPIEKGEFTFEHYTMASVHLQNF